MQQQTKSVWRDVLLNRVPNLIAIVSFGLAGTYLTTQGVEHSAEFYTVPGTVLIGGAVSELARVVNSILEDHDVAENTEKLSLDREEEDKIARALLALRTLLETTPGIPTNVRREQLEGLRRFEQLFSRRRDITGSQLYELRRYVDYLMNDYGPRLERYARKHGGTVGISGEKDLQE